MMCKGLALLGLLPLLFAQDVNRTDMGCDRTDSSELLQVRTPTTLPTRPVTFTNTEEHLPTTLGAKWSWRAAPGKVLIGVSTTYGTMRCQDNVGRLRSCGDHSWAFTEGQPQREVGTEQKLLPGTTSFSGGRRECPPGMAITGVDTTFGDHRFWTLMCGTTGCQGAQAKWTPWSRFLSPFDFPSSAGPNAYIVGFDHSFDFRKFDRSEFRYRFKVVDACEGWSRPTTTQKPSTTPPLTTKRTSKGRR